MRNLLNKLKGKKINKKLISIMLSVLIAFTFTAGYFISVVNASTIEVSNLQIGDTITLGRVGDLDLVWRVVGFDNDGQIYKTGTNPYVVLENWMDLTYYKGLQFDFPHTDDDPNYANRTYGTNEWEDSALRKLLNSTEDAAHVDYTDSYYSGSGYGLNGFLHDFSSEEINLIKDTTHIFMVDDNSKNYLGNTNVTMPYGDETDAKQDYRTMSRCQFIGYNNLLNYKHKESTEKIFLMSYYEYGQAQQKGYSGGFVWSDGATDGKHYFMLRDSSTYEHFRTTINAVRWVHWNKLTNTQYQSDIGGSNVPNHYIEELDANVADENTYIRPACVLDGSKTLSVRSEGDYYVPKPSLEDATIEGIQDEIFYDGTDKKQSGYTVKYNGNTLAEVTGDGDTDASKLEIGDLVTLGRLNNHSLIWRVVGFDEECNASGSDPYLVLENWMDTEFDKYAGIGTNQVMAFDAAHTGDTSSNRNSNGSNFWDTSTLKTWLNSNETYDKIDYTHEYYTAGNPYGERDGFLHEFNEDEKNSIKEVTHKNIIHEQDIDLKDGGSANYWKSGGDTPQTIVDNYDTAYFKNTTEKVFCMSIKEIKNAITNDTNFVYYKSGRYYWLRDAAFSGSQYEFYIHDSGKVWANEAYNTSFFRLRPAVILKHDAALKTLSSSADSDYEVTSPVRGDFKVSYTGDLISPGEVTITFTGCGSFGGTKTFTYNIIKKSMNDVEVTGIEDTIYYDGTPKKQSGYVLKDEDGNTLTEVLGDGDTDATKLKLGDIVTLGKLGGHPLKWRVVGFDEDCLETGTNPYLILDNYTDTELSAYTGFEFDPKHDDTDSAVYARDGYNNWGASTLRKWYNSSDTTIDYSHDHYANVDPYGKPGFLHEFEDYETGAIKPVTHKYVVDSFEEHGSNGTAIHTWKDNKRLSDTGSDHPLQNYENAYYQTCEDKVFASNILEISNAYKWKGTSGYEYSGDAVYWLRDELCYGSGTLTASQTRRVRKHETYNEGVVDGSNPYDEGAYLSLRPALVLKAETSLKTLESGKYQVAQPGVGEYTVSYSRTNGDSSDLTSPGEIKITFTGAGSYGGTKTFTYNIVKKSMDDVEVAPLTDFVYNGESQLQSSFTLKYKDETPLVQKTSDADSTISNLKLGDIVSLGKLGDTKLLWRVVGFGVNCESDSSKGAPYLVLENWKDSSLSSYRGMIFDPKHDATDTSDRNNWGSNNWETSTIRKWLNSDVKASDIDYTHTHYTSGTDPYNKDGFLYGFTQSEKDAIASVTHKNLVRSSESNTPDRHDGGSTNLGYNYQIPACVNGYDGAYYQNTTDKIFFMNMKELCNAINNKDASGFVYCDSNSLKYIYFLRDAEAQYESNIRDAYYNGNIASAAAYSVYSDGCLRPAIILSEDAGLKACDIASDSCNFKIAETIYGDFTVSYSSDTTNVGEVTVTFTGCGSYEGTKTATYNILSNEIDTDDITIEISDEITYTGSAIELSADDITVKVKSGGEFVTIDSSNYTITGYSEDHTNAGNASVTIKLSGIFDSDPVTKNFTIHQVDITNNDDVTMPNLQQNLVYTGEALTPTGMAVKWKETTLTNNVDYNASPANNTNAGVGNVIVIAKGNFTGTKTFNFPIAKKDISSNDKITISTITDKEKTGSQIQPEFKIYDGDILFAGSPKELTAWSDYTVSYGENKEVGEGTITITGDGNYTGSKTFTFNIVGRLVNASDVTFDIDDDSFVYSGTAKEPSYTVKLNGEYLFPSSDYDFVKYANNINATTETSKAEVVIRLKGDYSCESDITGYFDIKPLDMTGNYDIAMPYIDSDTFNYDGNAKQLSNTEVTWKGSTLDSENYEISYDNNVNAGTLTAKVIVSGKKNFKGSRTFFFTIGQRDISTLADITVSEISPQTWTGEQIKPTGFTVHDSLTDKDLVLGTDYTVDYDSNNVQGLSAGGITIYACGNYKGTKFVSFDILPQKITDMSRIEISVDDSDLIYTGEAITPDIYSKFTVKLDDEALSWWDYSLVSDSWENNVNAGVKTASCMIQLVGNLITDPIEVKFTIHPIEITDNSDITMPNVNADNFKYTGSSLTPSDMTVKWNSNTLTDNDYTISVTDNVDAGTAKVTVTGKNNFTGSKVFNFTIGKRSFEDDTIEYFVPDEEYQSGVQIKPTSFTVKDSTIDRNLVLGTDYSIDPDGYGANNVKGDNSGSITITGGGNFEGTKVLYFNIVGAKINDLSKITATLDDSDLIFTGEALTPSDKITVSLDGVGVLTSDDWEVVGASWTNNTNAGNASVKVKLKGNYSSDPVTINFTIKQKELDITDFAFSGSGVATKEVTLKSEYSDVVPTSEQAKLLVKYGDVVLNFTSAKFKGISASDNPMKFGNCAITLSGLSLSDTNYKLKDTFTSFEVDSTHGLIVDKIKPELLSAFVTILDGTYKTGDMIYIELNYDKDILLNGNDPKLEFYSNVLADGKIGTLETNKYKAKAIYDSISGNKVKFKYEVKEGDYLPNGFTFALSGIINFESLVDSNGNAVNYSNETKRFDNVIVLSKSGVFDEIKKLIEGNDTNKELKILDILKDDDKTDLIFDTEPDLKLKIGSGASNDDARRKAAEYLAKNDDLDLSDITKLIDEIKRALHAKELEDEIKAKLDSQTPPTKEEIDDMMIKYQKLSSNEKKVFDSNLKTRLEELYYANLTADWKYKDSPSGEANEIEMYGIVSRTSAAIGKAVKLKVERIYDNARINELQGMVEANPGSTGERIIAPYDINLVDSDDVPVTIPGENVLCKIELPVGYYGKVINIYHKVDDTHIETVQNKLIQKIGDKCLVYFDCDSFSPYFMTSDAVSVKASLDPESTEGTVSPLGLFTVNQGENKDFIFTKSGETNRVDITLSKFNNQTKTFDLISGIDPINLFNTSKHTLKNITTNMFITFKLSHDDNFKKSGGSSGGGGGGGGSTPKPQEPVVPVPPAQPEKEFEVFNAYMKGYEDGTFGPQLNMTRAEAATIIARISEDFSEDANFKEISKSYKDYNSRHWANNYIGYVTEVGIMCGDEEGFRPDDKITRGEFSKLIYKLLNLENANLAIVKTFDDCKGQFYETYANALYSAGILTGYEDGTFNGSGKLTRTEAAIMINKATGRGLDKEETLKAIKESENFKEFKDVSSNRWFYFDDMMATVSYSLEKETDQTLVDNPKKD